MRLQAYRDSYGDFRVRLSTRTGWFDIATCWAWGKLELSCPDRTVYFRGPFSYSF